MTYVSVRGGYERGDIAVKVAEWCVEHFDIEPKRVDIQVNHAYKDCWGACDEVSRGEYSITVVARQSLRDFIATVAHEMVHVKQWETGRWSGDGEKEAERLQYKLADKIWEEDVI